VSKSVHKVSTTARMHFTVYNSSNTAVTGLADGDFTKLLAKDDATDATTVTVSEVGSGRYVASFTPASTGTWYLVVRQATHAPRGWHEAWEVTTGGVLSTSDIADGLLDRTDGVETGVTPRQALQRIGAATAGECAVSDDGATVTFKGMDDQTIRLTTTVNPETGARSVVTYS
jgi:hypothetical protein